ncbi:MAG: sigma-54-dependent Fis family transcriptional regulator [Pirellulaceae bacterium]|nr:sigma-54-dependent Fis family transcriptional regulator [Pirellulaceae bacterium]
MSKTGSTAEPLFEVEALRDWSQVYGLASRHPPARDFLIEGLSGFEKWLPRADGDAGDSGVALATSILQALVRHLPGLSSIEWVRGQKGGWSCLANSDGTRTLPPALARDWLADVLDSDRPSLQYPWGAIGLRAGHRRDQLLVFHWSTAASAQSSWPQIAAWAAVTECLLAWQSLTCSTLQTASHLRRLLDLIAQWNRSLDTPSLLKQIAETSTRWIPAERATIFLWDRVNKVLIGRPALGVADDDLKIPDHSGLVGQVVQTGLAGRVDAEVADEQAQVDRRTDNRLNFRTRTLLCVPLWDDDGKCLGAFELINKLNGNFSDQDQYFLELLAKHAAIAVANLDRVERLVTTQKTTAAQAAAAVQLRGSCPLMETLRQSLIRVAGTDLSVLLLGENGTGKEVAAQLLHYESQRRNEVLIAVNCAAIPETLLESELFGHEKGAFTDAIESRAGKFELASQGTIFLDEIGDMSLSGQAKLLRVLEEKMIVRVGGSRSIPTYARVIAATNQNLAELVRQRRFREDLFFRLNVVTLEIPPLRLRGDDVIELATFFLDGFCRQARRPTPLVTPAAEKSLRLHLWPGNVRELRNMMERVAFLSTSNVLEPSDLSFISWHSNTAAGVSPVDRSSLELPLTEATRLFQINYIEQQIDLAKGNMSLAADRMGLHRTNLYRKMKQLEMEVSD